MPAPSLALCRHWESDINKKVSFKMKFSIYPSIDFIKNYLANAFQVPDTCLINRDITVNKTDMLMKSNGKDSTEYTILVYRVLWVLISGRTNLI